MPQNQPRRFQITNANSSSQSRPSMSSDESKRSGGGIFAASYWLKTLVENASDVKQLQQKYV